MQKLNSKKLSLKDSHSVLGSGCGTSYRSSSGATGKDTYFDDNDNGRLDKGDTIYFDNGTVGTMNAALVNM